MEAFTVLIILLWIGCGIWSGSIASKKNRDTTGWFIIGIILGIFGVIIAYLVEPLTSSSDKKNNVNPDTLREKKKCPDCAEMIFAEAKVCRYCKRTFTEAEIKNALELEKNYLPYTDKTKVNVFINKSDYFDNGKIICPICKIFSPPHFKKCNNCGVGFFITKSNQK